MSKKLSVIMPAYNAELTIKKAIESVLISQSDDIELIVVDDGSTDSTKDIVCSFNDPRINYIKKNNSGVSDTRNKGLERAKGEYVTFIDSDDCYTCNGIDRILDLINSKSFDLLIFGFYKELIKSNKVFQTEANTISSDLSFKSRDGSYYFQYLFRSSHILLQTSWNKVFKRDIILNNDIKFNKDLVCYENLTMILDYLKYADDVIIVSDILYKYNVIKDASSDNFQKRDNLDLTSNVSACYKKFLELCKRYEYPKEYIEFMNAAFLQEFIFCSRKYFSKSKNFTKKQQFDAFQAFLNDEGYLAIWSNYLCNYRFYNILYKLNNCGLKHIAYKLYEKVLIKK